MTPPVSSSSGPISTAIQPTLDKTMVHLEAVRHARGDINEIRMLLKGNTKICFNLFKQAVEV